MKKCDSCGKLANEHLDHCPDCGADLPIFESSDDPSAYVPPPLVPPLPVTGDDGLAPDHILMGNYAGFWIRFVAISIDGIVSTIVQIPLYAIVFAISGSDMESMSGGMTVVAYGASLLFWGANNIYLQSTYGWTIGKKVCGLVVLTADGEYMSIGRALGREIFKSTISTIVCMLGFIMAGFDADKQGWHDKIAGTYVYYD